MTPRAFRPLARAVQQAVLFALGLVILAAPAPAAEPVLTFDYAPGRPLPINFRLADGGTDPNRPDIGLRLSGSSEFDVPGLDHLAAALPRPLLIVDLRQESHGFLDATPVVWRADKDQGNYGKTPAEAAADEATRLAALRGQTSARVALLLKKDKDGGVKKSETHTVNYAAVSSEADLTAARGIGYLRLYVTDDMAPDAVQVDRFIAAVRGLPKETWLHMHCHAGHGRTTTFMVMYALLFGPGGKDLDRIAAEQAALGGAELLGKPKKGWQRELYLAREAFLRDFAAYAAANPGGRPMTYGQWRATH
jgi:hypothetical protein